MVNVIKSELLDKLVSTRISTGEVLGCLSYLSDCAGLNKLNIYLDTLPPGHRSSPPHFHSEKEEFIFVIEALQSLYLDVEMTILFHGEAVGFQ